LEFCEKQLAEFYAPLLALRAETKAEAHLREYITDKAGLAWGRLMEESEGMSPAERRKLTDERKPDFAKMIDYNNTKAMNDLLPAYRQMVALLGTTSYEKWSRPHVRCTKRSMPSHCQLADLRIRVETLHDSEGESVGDD